MVKSARAAAPCLRGHSRFWPKVAANDLLVAARRVQQRIDRELKNLRDLGQAIDHLPKPRRPREKRIVPLTRVTYSLAEFCEKTGLREKAVLRAIRLETVCRALAKLERENIVRVVPKGLQLLGSLQSPLLLQRRCKPD